ncbi:unnamed protein product [Prorocentrum cordatum]|uniref:ZZ-type domain-containing protein n=1 Tax=Prorocentrum cordatum TaxID=2364126 RepID=A0ABN9RAK5_9DINO|nr:unnamed protein product [Polarella glacialis]
MASPDLGTSATREHADAPTCRRKGCQMGVADYDPNLIIAYKCDLCGKSNTISWRCEACDHDICFECHPGPMTHDQADAPRLKRRKRELVEAAASAGAEEEQAAEEEQIQVPSSDTTPPPRTSKEEASTTPPTTAHLGRVEVEDSPRRLQGAPRIASRRPPDDAPGRRALLPWGALDIYVGPMAQYQPAWGPAPAAGGGALLEVLAMPLHLATEELRKTSEGILHAAWRDDDVSKQTISSHLGLQLNGMRLRNGKQTSRCSSVARGGRVDKWLVWERTAGAPAPSASSGRMVGALLLRRQVPKDHRSKGAISIDYVSAQRSAGGKGWPMVQAAEAICRGEGFRDLWSAADLSQDGGANWDGKRDGSALAAHRRWGFSASSAAEWKATGLELYDEQRCRVAYMRKALHPWADAPAALGCEQPRARAAAAPSDPAAGSRQVPPRVAGAVAAASPGAPPAAPSPAGVASPRAPSTAGVSPRSATGVATPLAPAVGVASPRAAGGLATPFGAAGPAAPGQARSPATALLSSAARAATAGSPAARVPPLASGGEAGGQPRAEPYEERLQKEIERCRKLQEIDQFLEELQHQEQAQHEQALAAGPARAPSQREGTLQNLRALLGVRRP